MAVGASTGLSWLVAAGAGVSAYGLAYLVVHDVCVHGRLSHGKRLVIGRWLRWVASSHDVHHRTGAAPYGFLFPVMLGSRSTAQTWRGRLGAPAQRSGT
jgi:beta-carotene 3-hydroxylase